MAEEHEDLVKRVLGGVRGTREAAERARAEELVRAKLRRETLSGDDVRITRRLVGMLARRGYSQNLACEVVLAELGAERERRRV